jgi:ABC-type branched-subunit amino acid transport system ATPase component
MRKNTAYEAPAGAKSGAAGGIGDPILSGKNVTVRFGGLTAVDHVDFEIARGSIQGLIGPNGAGKTTLFNAVTAQAALSEGSLLFHAPRGGVDITGKSPRDSPAGIARGPSRTPGYSSG